MPGLRTHLPAGGEGVARSAPSNGASAKTPLRISNNVRQKSQQHTQTAVPNSDQNQETKPSVQAGTPTAPFLAVRERRLRRIINRLQSQLPRSVRELANEVHLSPSHLQRLFKQETGTHLSDVLLERKLCVAEHLLSTTEMEIKEVAYAVGYGHHSSFVRAFERRFGQSPKRYRQEHDGES